MKERSGCTNQHHTTVHLYLYVYLHVYVQYNAVTVTVAPLRKKDVKGIFLLPPGPHTGSGGVYGGAGMQTHTDYPDKT